MTAKEVIGDFIFGVGFLAVCVFVVFIALKGTLDQPTPKPLPTMEEWMKNR